MIQRAHIGIFILFVLVGCAENQTQKTPNDLSSSTPAPKKKKPKKSDSALSNSDDAAAIKFYNVAVSEFKHQAIFIQNGSITIQ
jgi:hypothetical protein